MMRIAFYGSSLVSSYWNGAATYYRGLIRNLAQLGHDITFYEPDAYDRQAHRDMDEPSWARSVVYPATGDGLARVIAEAALADVVVKASGVGIFDDELLAGVMSAARLDALRIFWDVDAPATLAEIRMSDLHPLRTALPWLDAVMTYGGGPPVIEAFEALGARRCVPIYNALDPTTHYPVPEARQFAGDLGFLGNRLPDREARVGEFFLTPARLMPHLHFNLGGSGWEDKAMPANVRRLGHVYTHQHNAFNRSNRAVLNIARDSMAATGFSPATRVFEAAGAGACLITDRWEGIELFLKPGEEILVARDGQDVAGHLAALTPEQARGIGLRAQARVLDHHTYAIRAIEVDAVLREELSRRRQRSVA